MFPPPTRSRLASLLALRGAAALKRRSVAPAAAAVGGAGNVGQPNAF